MKFFALAAVASATRTRLRDFDPVDYTADWYGGHDESYYAPNDPYVDYHDDHGHHGHSPRIVYADPTPVVYDDHYDDHYDDVLGEATDPECHRPGLQRIMGLRGQDCQGGGGEGPLQR